MNAYPVWRAPKTPAQKNAKKPAPKCWARPSVSNGKPTEGRTHLALHCGLRYIPSERTCTTGGKVASFYLRSGRRLSGGFHYQIWRNQHNWISGSSIKTRKASGDGDEPRRTAALWGSPAKATTTARTAKRTLDVTAGPVSPCLSWGGLSPAHSNCPRCTWLFLAP